MSCETELLHLQGVERQRGRAGNAFSLRVEEFRLHRGECVAVIGPSGSGKSTFLDLLGLALRPDRAETFVFRDRNGRLADIGALWRDRRDDRLAGIRALDVGYVLQTGGLLPFLRVRQNVALSRRLLGLPEDGFIDELLARLDIAHLADKEPRALSIGERQRTAIARAFAHRPALVLADEPTASLDPHQGFDVCKLMLSLGETFGISVVIVSHDWGLVRTLGLAEAVVTPDRRTARSLSRIDYSPLPQIADAASRAGDVSFDLTGDGAADAWRSPPA